MVTQRETLVVGIAYDCPYYTGPAIFHLFFKVPRVKNRLFPTNLLPLCKPLRFVQSAKSLVQLGNTFNYRIKRLKLSNIENNCDMLCSVCSSYLCNKKTTTAGKKCPQLSLQLPLPSHKLHTFPKIHKKKVGEYL